MESVRCTCERHICQGQQEHTFNGRGAPMGIPLFSLMRKRAASCAAGSLVTMPEAVQNASCSTTGGKDATVMPEENGPENRNKEDVPEPSPSCDAGGSGGDAATGTNRGEYSRLPPSSGGSRYQHSRTCGMGFGSASRRGGAGSCRAGVSGRRKPGRGDPLARPEEQQRRTAE